MFMCFSTTKLRFVRVVNYLAPGFSYKYMKAYGCTVQKGLIRVYRRLAEARGTLSSSPSNVLEPTKEQGYNRRGLRPMPGSVVLEPNDVDARLSRLVQ